MKKTALLVFLSLLLFGCGGYFDRNRNEGNGGLKTLALIGGGTLSDDDAQDQSPFLFRSGGRAYLFFSSDRGTPGQMNIWYAEMDPFTETFFTPVLMHSDINSSLPEESPVIFEWTNGNIYLSVLRRAGTPTHLTWRLDASFSPVAQVYSNDLVSSAAMMGLLQDPTNPMLLVPDGTSNVGKFSFMGNFWQPQDSIALNFAAASANGFISKGDEYYIFSSTLVQDGVHQIYTGSSLSPVFIKNPMYMSPFKDFTPFVDPETYKVYFASDRYANSNFDLYRYNLLTYDLTMGGYYVPPATVIYVSPSGNDGNSGLTPGSALLSIGKAVALAGELGYEFVYAEAGMYTPGAGLEISGAGVVLSNTNVDIMGGWDSGFGTTSGFSVLDGNNTLERIILFDGATNVTVSFFVIQNNENNAGIPDIMGGGVFFRNSDNCGIFMSTISNCSATNGGAAAFSNSTDCAISITTISSNIATNGGGIYVYEEYVGLVNLSVINNTARNRGAGLFFFTPAQGYIGMSVFTNNQSMNINSTIHFYAAGDGSSLSLSDNWLGGKGPSRYAIYEEAELSNHIMMGNIFIVNQIDYLYRNFTNTVETIITNSDWFNINVPSWTGASLSVNNLATNL